MISKKNFILAIIPFFSVTYAFAGPKVDITFHNQTTADVSYIVTNKNESSTYAIAFPRPMQTVIAGSGDFFTVASMVSPDANYAIVHYKAGEKECIFGTTFVNASHKNPQWNKSENSVGGAVCEAQITSKNIKTFEWAVEFTMK